MMDHAQYKAVIVAARYGLGRRSLVEAFNAWLEEVQPAEIVHIHYFHDRESHARGYQVLYKEDGQVPSTRPA